MSELTVVEFETTAISGQTYVSELSDGPPFTVHGIALGAGDITVGQSGIKKKWPADELSSAADSLKGTNLVVDHNNDATGVVGRVTKAGYKEGTGVVYEAELFDDKLAEKVQNGLLEVSIRGYHADVDSLEEDDETDAKIVEDIEFDNLSIVPTGAAPSNTLQMGEHAELSAAELSAFTDELEKAELQEIEPGMWVKSDGTKGITVSQVQDGEIEVDIYEESDGKWRSTGETEMFDTGSLDEWDVDEEEDIGAAEDEEDDESDEDEESEDEESEDEEENEELIGQKDKVQWDATDGLAKGVVVDRQEDGCFEDRISGDAKVCAEEGDPVLLINVVRDGEKTGELVAHNESTVEQTDFSLAELEASDGDFVQWKGVNDEMLFGQIVSINQDGQQMVADIRRFTEGGDALDEIVQKPIQGLERWDRMNEESDSPDDMRDDATGGIQAPDWQDGQMVKWQVNPAMKGKIVHVDRDKKVLMVEVMEETEQGLQPTGFTLTAGFQDVIPMDGEMAAVTTRDMPTQDAEPTHDTDSVNNLLKRFIEEQGGSNPTLSDFVDWMSEENLAIERGEGEEERIDSQKDLDNSHEEEPHRYIDAEDEQLETFSDYPEAASENAQMALDAREETGNPNDCGTDVGWRRANQLADGEAVSRDVVAKMSAFNRHRQNSDQSEEEGKADCGWMMWKAWGGDEGVDWAMRKMDKIEEENSMDDVPSEMLFKDREEALEKADDLDLNGAHEMDGRWVPGETHEEFVDSEAVMGKHHHEASMEMVDEFMGEEGNDEETFVSAFLEWADDDNVRQAVDEFVAKEDNSLESGMSDFIAWLETKVDEAESGTHSEDMDEDEDEEEMAETEELQDYEFHTPDWSGTTESEWSTPDLEDFDTDDLSEVADHFLISATGFPPENFTDLKLPVVEPNGDLNVNALSAVKGGRGVSAVDGLSSDMEEDIVDWVNETANSEFDRDWGTEEEASAAGGSSGRPTASKTVGGVKVLSGDDLRHSSYKSEESDVDELTTQITTMTSNIEEKLSELDEPVAVEASEVEELRDKADRFEEMSENLEALRERTDILDEVDREQVEALADSDDPVVKESARYEELTSEAEQVAGVYAAQLAEEYAAFSAEELTDKFSIEELREKFEEQIGDVEEELASSDEAEPRSQDADEESLEDAADESEDDSDAEELADEAAAKQEELLNKITGN